MCPRFWIDFGRRSLSKRDILITAEQYIRKMGGGAHSHLMLASDGHPYVIKFQNNPQNLRVLAAEYLGTHLAVQLGLTMPHCEVVDVSAAMIENTPELTVVGDGGLEVPCQAGRQCGSQHVGGLMPGNAVEYLPEPLLKKVKNLHEFIGVLVFDKWSCNHDGRQAIFTKRGMRQRTTATFIDQGFCFGAGDWKLKDAPLRGVYARNLPYAGITGWNDFDPWLSRLSRLEPQIVWRIAQSMPAEWYDGAVFELERLVEALLSRRTRVAALIEAFRTCSRNPFPKWRNI